MSHKESICMTLSQSEADTIRLALVELVLRTDDHKEMLEFCSRAKTLCERLNALTPPAAKSWVLQWDDGTILCSPPDDADCEDWHMPSRARVVGPTMFSSEHEARLCLEEHWRRAALAGHVKTIRWEPSVWMDVSSDASDTPATSDLTVFDLTLGGV